MQQIFVNFLFVFPVSNFGLKSHDVLLSLYLVKDAASVIVLRMLRDENHDGGLTFQKQLTLFGWEGAELYCVTSVLTSSLSQVFSIKIIPLMNSFVAHSN